MARYLLSSRAHDGLARIRDSVESRHGSEVAARVLARLARAFELLAARPLVGHLRPDIVRRRDTRFWSVPPTLIAYRFVDPDGIEVLAVERGEVDWNSLFVQRGDG